MATKEEYRARKATQETKYKNKILERFFSWWRNPPDRFSCLIALFTALLCFATVKLWLATNDLVDDAKKSNRAWIAPRIVSIQNEVKDGDKIHIGIIYENTGKTPALNVVLKAEARTINGEAPIEARLFQNAKLGENLSCKKGFPIYAGAIYPASTHVGNQADFFTDDPDLPGRLRNISTILAIHGCFEYETIGEKHTSRFCEYLEPATGKPIQHWLFKTCADGNDAD